MLLDFKMFRVNLRREMFSNLHTNCLTSLFVSKFSTRFNWNLIILRPTQIWSIASLIGTSKSSHGRKYFRSDLGVRHSMINRFRFSFSSDHHLNTGLIDRGKQCWWSKSNIRMSSIFNLNLLLFQRGGGIGYQNLLIMLVILHKNAIWPFRSVGNESGRTLMWRSRLNAIQIMRGIETFIFSLEVNQN